MSEAMTYKLPPLPKNLPNVVRRIRACEGDMAAQVVFEHALNNYAIAAIEAQGVPDGYAGAAAFTNVMPTVAIHFSATEQALSFLDKIRASWDRQQRSIASTHSAPQAEQHPDDAAVDRFAAAMKDKLAIARQKGRGGWETCSAEDLGRMLREHVEKGDPRDVANFCMFLWSLGHGIAPQASVVQQEPVAWICEEQTIGPNYAKKRLTFLRYYSDNPLHYKHTPLYTHPAQQAKPQPLSADRDARIAELEQRNRDLHEDVKRFRSHALNEKDARMALERELAEVRKDAERYRWLQQEHARHDPLCHLSWKKNNARNGAEWVNTAQLEAAIDAAMKGQK